MCLFVGCVQRSHRLLSDAGSTAIAVVVVVIDSLSHTVPVHVTYHRLTISTSTLPRPCLFPRYPLPVAFLLYSFYSSCYLFAGHLSPTLYLLLFESKTLLCTFSVNVAI